MDNSHLHDLNFFSVTPGVSTGLTPFLNGEVQDANPFEDAYAAHSMSNSSRMPSEMSPVTIPSTTVVESFAPNVFDRSRSAVTSEASSESPIQSSTSSRPPKAGGKRKKSTDNVTSNAETNESEAHKRAKFLERNRLAAAKCRTKKKGWTNNLEAAARQASQQSRELQAILHNLRDEAMRYKTELMAHQGCECHEVRRYLLNDQARRLPMYHDPAGHSGHSGTTE